MSHTTSRVLQAAAKAAGPEARAGALKEVSPDLLTLAKSSYGHFLAAKLISLAPKEEVPGEGKKNGSFGFCVREARRSLLKAAAATAAKRRGKKTKLFKKKKRADDAFHI